MNPKKEGIQPVGPNGAPLRLAAAPARGPELVVGKTRSCGKPG